MSKRQPRPLAAFAAPVVHIVARPIKCGWRFCVVPQGHGKVTAYTLPNARTIARLYSRRIVEVGPPAAFHRRGTP